MPIILCNFISNDVGLEYLSEAQMSHFVKCLLPRLLFPRVLSKPPPRRRRDKDARRKCKERNRGCLNWRKRRREGLSWVAIKKKKLLFCFCSWPLLLLPLFIVAMHNIWQKYALHSFVYLLQTCWWQFTFSFFYFFILFFFFFHKTFQKFTPSSLDKKLEKRLMLFLCCVHQLFFFFLSFFF